MRGGEEKNNNNKRKGVGDCLLIVCMCVCVSACVYVCVADVLYKAAVAQRGVWARLHLGLGIFLEYRPWNSTARGENFYLQSHLTLFPKTDISLISCWPKGGK